MSRQNMFYWQADRPYTHEEINKIFLERKNSFDKDEIMRAAANAMGENILDLKDPINQGSVNLVCPFITISGKQGVIRVHPPLVRNEYFYAESCAMKTAKSYGVSTADTILVDDSRNIVPFDYMVMSKIPGEVMRPAIERNPEMHPIFLKQIGQNLAKLHKIETEGFGFFDNKLAKNGILCGTKKSNKDHFLSAIDLDEDYHANNISIFEPTLIKKSIKLIKSMSDLADCKNPTLIHNDIADWNTVVDGNKVTGILDWDECFSGDPVFEFATLSLFYNDEKMESILSGYRENISMPLDYVDKFDIYVLRYILNKSKIAITKIKYSEKTSMKSWLENANIKMHQIVQRLK